MITLVFLALLPGYAGDPLPAIFPRRVRWALAASAWIAAAYSLITRARRFSQLDPDDRERLIDALAHHRWAWLRALVQWWKLTALLTL
ncbi:MAG: hypothetical protein IT384_25265 [Deltaproteobacteria bacterium]|nr:hypothetical protein [Deltaproteobacteria bacterium]